MCTSTSCPRMTCPRWCSWATYGKCLGCRVSKPTASRWVPNTGCQPCGSGALLCSSPLCLSSWRGDIRRLPGPAGEWNGSIACLRGQTWASRLVGNLNCALRQGGAKQEWENPPLSENTVVLEGRVPSCEPLTQILPFPDAYTDSWWQDQCLLLLASWARCDLQCHSVGSSLEHFCCIHTCAYICLQLCWPGR